VTGTGATDQNDQTGPTDRTERKDPSEEEGRTEATGTENAETEIVEIGIGTVTVVTGIVATETETRNDDALALQDIDHLGLRDVTTQTNHPHQADTTGTETGISAADTGSHDTDDRTENGTTESVDHGEIGKTVEADQSRMIVLEGTLEEREA
jgi:hypothetical protein